MYYGKLHVLHVGLGDIRVLGYHRDKYIHDNIIASILAYHNNRANNNTASTVNTTSTLPLSTVCVYMYMHNANVCTSVTCVFWDTCIGIKTFHYRHDLQITPT